MQWSKEVNRNLCCCWWCIWRFSPVWGQPRFLSSLTFQYTRQPARLCVLIVSGAKFGLGTLVTVSS